MDQMEITINSIEDKYWDIYDSFICEYDEYDGDEYPYSIILIKLDGSRVDVTDELSQDEHEKVQKKIDADFAKHDAKD